MSGIMAIVSLDGRTVPAELARAQLEAIAHRGEWAPALHEAPGIALGHVNMPRTPEAERDYPKIEKATRRLEGTWQILDRHLSDRRYVAGDTLTIGDIPLGATCYRYFGLPIERPQLANVERWYARLKRRAAFREHVMVPIT